MNTETKTRTTWEIYEEPRLGAKETTALFEWSRNYDAGKGPATVFLALISYEMDGEPIALPNMSTACLGFMELDYLGDALKEYAGNPETVNDAIAELLEAESNE
jgi:hypothetical protein